MRVMKTSPIAQEAPCHGRSDGIFSQLLTIRCAPDLERSFTKHNGPIEPRRDLIVGAVCCRGLLPYLPSTLDTVFTEGSRLLQVL